MGNNSNQFYSFRKAGKYNLVKYSLESFFNNFSVAQAYVNQKKLDSETKILQNNATHFAKQTAQWLKLIEDFNTSLKVCDFNCQTDRK